MGEKNKRNIEEILLRHVNAVDSAFDTFNTADITILQI